MVFPFPGLRVCFMHSHIPCDSQWELTKIQEERSLTLLVVLYWSWCPWWHRLIHIAFQDPYFTHPSESSNPPNSKHQMVEIGGLEIERQNWEALNCFSVIAMFTQQSLWPGTLKIYARHLKNFVNWFPFKEFNSSICEPVRFLDFLQEDFMHGLAVSAIWSQSAGKKVTRVSSISDLACRLLKSFFLKKPLIHFTATVFTGFTRQPPYFW